MKKRNQKPDKIAKAYDRLTEQLDGKPIRSAKARQAALLEKRRKLTPIQLGKLPPK